MALQIKVCGMQVSTNISELVKLPIDYIGFIFYDQSPRFIRKIPPVDIPKYIKKVGVFVNESIDGIQKKIDEEGLQVIQLHGTESPETCKKVQNMGPSVIKAFGIHEEFDWEQLTKYSPYVDYFLFDTGSKQHGGTGISFNWNILKGYELSIPYFLSGGLSSDNIISASRIDDKRLIGLDLNSKFEIKPGLKNIEELQKALNLITYE